MNATGDCQNCKFFLTMDSTKEDGLGECHRHPPRTDALLLGVRENEHGIPVPQFSMVVIAARTHLTNWCGEFVKGLVIPKASDLALIDKRRSPKL